MFEEQVILITGGTGSWGTELVRQLIEKHPKEIRIFSRGELAQVRMSRKLNNKKLKFIIGDVRDKNAILAATKGVDYIFHLAALKHVDICEEQPLEAVKTNILGVQNIIEASIENKVKKVIDVSTDKAVEALNLYGTTKAVGEHYIIQANQLSRDTRFVCVRAGNVLGSNGSVVPFFINQIKTENRVTITDNRMTRYFITLQEAIRLLFQAAQYSYGGEIIVMQMPSYQIRELADVLIEYYGNKDTKITQIGMRPGEKLHEVLVSNSEASHTYYYRDNYFIIMPTIYIEGLKEYYEKQQLQPVRFERYTSNDTVLGREALVSLLKDGKFIYEKDTKK